MERLIVGVEDERGVIAVPGECGRMGGSRPDRRPEAGHQSDHRTTGPQRPGPAARMSPTVLSQRGNVKRSPSAWSSRPVPGKPTSAHSGWVPQPRWKTGTRSIAGPSMPGPSGRPSNMTGVTPLCSPHRPDLHQPRNLRARTAFALQNPSPSHLEMDLHTAKARADIAKYTPIAPKHDANSPSKGSTRRPARSGYRLVAAMVVQFRTNR